jgi:hypothetical protein
MNKQFVTTLSTVVVIAIIVVVNFIVGGSSIGNFLRFDLTQDKLYISARAPRTSSTVWTPTSR